jgi:hypothetical protein
MVDFYVDPEVAVSRGTSKKSGEWRVAPMFRLRDGSEIVFDLSVEAAEDFSAKLEAELVVIRASGRN